MLKRKIVPVLIVLMLLAVTFALPSQAWGNCVQSYRVQFGQTLAGIARYFGTSVGYLASINGITNPNRIFAGQVICVQVATPPPQTTYVVQRGDWLSLIAQRFGVSLYALIQANNIRNPNWIFPGQVLVIPSNGYGGGYGSGGYGGGYGGGGYNSNPPVYNAPSNNPPVYTPPTNNPNPPQYIPPPSATQEAMS